METPFHMSALTHTHVHTHAHTGTYRIGRQQPLEGDRPVRRLARTLFNHVTRHNLFKAHET